MGEIWTWEEVETFRQTMWECRRRRLRRAGYPISARRLDIPPDTPQRYALKVLFRSLNAAGGGLVGAVLLGWQIIPDQELVAWLFGVVFLLEAGFHGFGAIITILALMLSPWNEVFAAEDEKERAEAT